MQIDTQVTHKWPDRLGETIDPKNGHLPWWALPPLDVPDGDQQEASR